MTNAYLPNDLATFFVIGSVNADAPCLLGLKRPREARNFTWKYRWTIMRIQMQMLWYFAKKKEGPGRSTQLERAAYPFSTI
jgi:hypothetical protein